MFGYLVAATKVLEDDELSRYKSVYCGLCRSLKRCFGQHARLTLNFDMTFLVLLLSSLYEPETGATDYTTSVTYNMIESGASTVSSHIASNTKAVSATVLPASSTGANENTVKFTNVRDDSILNSLTGVFFNILPYITLAGASIFGVILVKKSKQQ